MYDLHKPEALKNNIERLEKENSEIIEIKPSNIDELMHYKISDQVGSFMALFSNEVNFGKANFKTA